MAETDLEKRVEAQPSQSHQHVIPTPQRHAGGGMPFTGRIGGNQEFVLDRNDPSNAALLQKVPDAAPSMSLAEALDLNGFRRLELWKAAVMEGVATMMLVFMTSWISISPSTAPLPTPSLEAGLFDTSSFIGPVVGGITNVILVALFIYSFSAVSGAHLNPLITLATFFARLTTLPRAVLYVVFQVVGASLAGLLVRAGYDSRDFKCGGCFRYPDHVSVGSAFAIEFAADLTQLFLAFGVGLDPRQRQIFGPALAPILVAFSSGVIGFGTAFSRVGYGGSGTNPARCFGIYVGSHFPVGHWVHWVAALLAGMVHAVFYCILPPQPI